VNGPGVGTGGPAPERFARRVTAYRVVSRAYFHLPIIVVFLATQGFRVVWIGLFLALYGLVVSLGDRVVAPVRARLSLPGSLVVGEAVKCLGLVVLLAPLSTATIVVSQVLSGLGFSMTAGTDAALASTLRSGQEYRTQESRTQMGMFVMSFAAGVTGAFVFTLWHRLPFALSALSCLAAAGIIVRQRVPLRSAEDVSPLVPTRGGDTEAVSSRARFWASYYSVNRAILLSTYTYLLPVLLFFKVHLRVEMFGAVLGLYTIFGLLAARLSLKLTQRGESRYAFFATGAATVVGLALLIPGQGWLAGVSIALLGLAGGLVRPATMMFLGPAMGDITASGRQRVMRSLERTQGRIQAALLVLTGACYAATHSVAGSFVALALAALAYNLVALGLAARASRHELVNSGGASQPMTVPGPSRSQEKDAGSVVATPALRPQPAPRAIAVHLPADEPTSSRRCLP